MSSGPCVCIPGVRVLEQAEFQILAAPADSDRVGAAGQRSHLRVDGKAAAAAAATLRQCTSSFLA